MRRAAEHQRDHHDVPQGPVLVEPRQVQRMEAVVQPAAHPLAAAIAFDDGGGLRIDVIAGAYRVVHADVDHGEGTLSPAIQVVGVVLVHERQLGQLAAGLLAHALHERAGIEARRRLAVNGYHARVAAAVRRQIHRLATVGGVLELFRLEIPHARERRRRRLGLVGLERQRTAPHRGLEIDVGGAAVLLRRHGQVREPLHDRKGPHRQQAAERPRGGDDAEDEARDRVPSLPALVGNAGRRPRMAIPFPR